MKNSVFKLTRSANNTARPFSTIPTNPTAGPQTIGVGGLSQFGGVHGNKIGSGTGTAKNWRNKPLFRRDGDKIFKTGSEACQLLISEASRADTVCIASVRYRI